MRFLFSVRSRRLWPVLLVCLALVVSPVWAQTPNPQPTPPQTLIPSPPQLTATSWILLDADSGRVLAEHNADQRESLADGRLEDVHRGR